MQLELDMERLPPRLATIEELVNAMAGKKKCRIATAYLKKQLMTERLREEVHG